MGPATGAISFRGTADDLLRLTIDGVTIIDAVSLEGEASSSVLNGNVEMKEVRSTISLLVPQRRFGAAVGLREHSVGWVLLGTA